MAHKWARWLHNPCRLGGPHRFKAGGKSQVAHKWARWPHNPCRLWGPHRFSAGGKINGGPQVGKLATLPVPPWGVPTASEQGGQNHRWPTSVQGGNITLATLGVPTASERGAQLQVAHKWARWVHNPCRLACPQRFRARGRIRGGPQVGKVAT